MKKNFTLKTMAMATLLTAGAFTANAQNVIEEGVAFSPKSEAIYTFTPSVTGNLTVEVGSYLYYMWGNFWGTFLYSDEALNEPVSISGSVEVSERQTNYMFKGLEAGETYYFMQYNYDGNVPFTFKMSEASASSEFVTDVFPNTRSNFNYVITKEMQISASGGVSGFGNVTLSYGDKEIPLDAQTYGIGLNGPSTAYFLQIGSNTNSEFSKLIAAIAYDGAESFTVTVTDLKAGGNPVVSNESGQAGVTVDNGTVSITYELKPAPLMLQDETYWPSTFYSYWEAGDKDGIAVLKFNQDISSVDEIQLIMGHVIYNSQTENVYAVYDMKGKTQIEGNTMSIDFTGVERYATGKADDITVTVSNIIGTNGMPVDMAGYGETNVLMFKYIPYSNGAYTGVASIEEATKGNAEVYNLQGVKLDKSNLKAGLYIINGKKVVIK